MLASLEAQLGPGPGGGGGGGEAGLSTTGTSFAFAAKVVGATLALTAAGILTLGVGAKVVHSISAPEASPPAVAAAQPAPTRTKRPEAPQAPQAVPDETLAAPVPAPDPTGEAKAKPQARAVASPDLLAEELALIEAARAAKDPAAALRRLDQHQSRFASGQLAHERERLRVEALCELGRLDEVRATIDGSSATLQPKLRAACPQASPSQG
jgi:hypothetical protein